jgi:hypothetical protein
MKYMKFYLLKITFTSSRISSHENFVMKGISPELNMAKALSLNCFKINENKIKL